MNDEQKALREAVIAAAVANLQPVQYSRMQAIALAWQVYKVAVGTKGGPGPWRPPTK